ncbi:MAG TPA: LamG-like jellyroll fold domain-containing protein [Opitutaceae bacterium]|nr:LamG-like jellyroll fold domain-containing protein [Opitutaceae bacterium]
MVTPRLLRPCLAHVSGGLCLLAGLLARPAAAAGDSGLLFYLSGDRGPVADYSAGRTPRPTFLSGITPIADGAKGGALSCSDDQLLAYRAPGNIGAQRGTLSFFWRSRYPVGPTQFALFRVGYADHSSWDMVWLRIDYNGHGFDAFVTDASLARTRVSVTLQPFPGPKEWTHLALSWDETRGIRFYVDGKLAAVKEGQARFDTGLDQFGPHSRIIAPYNVQSDYNFTRGGDIDEVRTYDRMLPDAAVAALARGEAPRLAPLAARTLADPRWRAEWYFRYGWNRAGDPPPELPAGPAASVRKVEIHDAFDGGRWWWKANDGIRETTWPGVYNRSRLPGRHDYFELPDWDCYVGSGKSVTFTLPDEPWNQLEISGAAWGAMSLLDAGDADDGPARALLFERPQGQERTYHRLARAIVGHKIRFTNVQQEEPIGELSAYNVTAGAEPEGSGKLAFTLRAQPDGAAASGLEALRSFVAGRYPADERGTLYAVPDRDGGPAEAAAAAGSKPGMPIVHLLVPDVWDGRGDGLDGIALDLPALDLKPAGGGVIPFNLQVKDPLWPARDMLDFSFSVKPGEAKTLWLDLRDRVLPAGKGFYLTLASASGGFGPGSLAGARLRLVFKPRAQAIPEQTIDRFTQARDSYAMLVEEHPQGNDRFDLWNRCRADLEDLHKVAPGMDPGRSYYILNLSHQLPAYQHADPAGVPLWASRQVALLGDLKRFVDWYIDHRQSAYGDFGGGISDDVDLLNSWPGTALMGSDPDKIRRSDRALIEAAYKNGMFTNGLPTIQADYLHSFEEGTNCLGQNMILDYGNPVLFERAMESARGVISLTGVNAAGHRHFKTAYFNGKKMATEGVWGWSRGYSNLMLLPGSLLVEYNGNPTFRKIVTELADGQLAHRRRDAHGRYVLPVAVEYSTDKEAFSGHTWFPWPLFWASYKWTGDARYLAPIYDQGVDGITNVNADMLDQLHLRASWGPRLVAGAEKLTDPAAAEAYLEKSRGSEYRNAATTALAWQVTGDKSYLERLYALQIAEADLTRFINTQGSLWIDRVGVWHADLQRVRLGGIALVRNGFFPGHTVSWRFRAPANDQSVAILMPEATPTSFKVIAYNLDTLPVHAAMTGWNVEPGTWEITQGVDTTGDDGADQGVRTWTSAFERSSSVDLTFAPRATTVLTFTLKAPGTPYWRRPDLGLSREDVAVDGGTVRVRVHSLGGVDAPASELAFRDAAGKIVATAPVPPLRAPADLYPKTADVVLTLPAGVSAVGGSVEIDPQHALEQITRLNDSVSL